MRRSGISLIHRSLGKSWYWFEDLTRLAEKKLATRQELGNYPGLLRDLPTHHRRNTHHLTAYVGTERNELADRVATLRAQSKEKELRLY